MKIEELTPVADGWEMYKKMVLDDFPKDPRVEEVLMSTFWAGALTFDAFVEAAADTDGVVGPLMIKAIRDEVAKYKADIRLRKAKAGGSA